MRTQGQCNQGSGWVCASNMLPPGDQALLEYQKLESGHCQNCSSLRCLSGWNFEKRTIHFSTDRERAPSLFVDASFQPFNYTLTHDFAFT